MTEPFLDLSVVLRATSLLREEAWTDKGILARMIDRKVTSAATQGTVAISLKAANLLSDAECEHLLSTFFSMAVTQPCGRVAWDMQEHISVWATARALQGILALDPGLLKAGSDRTLKLVGAFEWLEAQRNTDGGFGFKHGLETRVIYSSFVGQALVAAVQATGGRPDLQATFLRRLSDLISYFRRSGLNQELLWADGPGADVCPVSTLFAACLIKQAAPYLGHSGFMPSSTQLSHAGRIMREGLLRLGPFYSFRDETGVNWRFEEFIPGRINLLAEFFSLDDDIIDRNIKYMAENVLVKGRHCGWGYAGSSEPITWITALAIESIYFVADRRPLSSFVPAIPLLNNTSSGFSKTQRGRKIFVVHGHDHGVLETVCRFLERLRFEPVVLHEQANKGRTINAKFQEEAAGVGFAIILMTPDDVGGKRGLSMDQLRGRARQNVVFELGFFVGALGPGHVSALVKGDVERPSDIDGVAYISLESGNWKTDLGRELKIAGYEFDWNEALR